MNWLTVLLEPAKMVFSRIGLFIVNVLLVVIILIIGMIFSTFIKNIIVKFLRMLKIDVYSEQLGLDAIFEKGGIKYSLSELIGVISYWSVILVTAVVALTSVGIITPSVLDSIVVYVPNVIVAIFILICGMFVATFLKNVVLAAANNAGLAYSSLIAKITEVAVVVFAVLMTLEQLKIGVKVSEITLSIILGSLGLAFALSFGLGCKDLVGRWMNEFVDRMKKK